MNDLSPHRRNLLVSLVVLFAVLGASPARAALTRYVSVGGTSSGAGICSITIESFGSDPNVAHSESRSLLPPIFVVNSSISGGSSKSATATQIRNELDAALPADYVITLTTPDLIRIFRNVGTFTLAISNGVPGQTIQERSALPGLGPQGWAVLAFGMLGCGGWLLWKRPRIA